MAMFKACVICGGEFQARTKLVLTCSTACSNEQRKMRAREHRKVNRERINLRMREYRKANRARVNQYNHRYRKANLELVRIRSREWHEANREQISARRPSIRTPTRMPNCSTPPAVANAKLHRSHPVGRDGIIRTRRRHQ